MMLPESIWSLFMPICDLEGWWKFWESRGHGLFLWSFLDSIPNKNTSVTSVLSFDSREDDPKMFEAYGSVGLSVRIHKQKLSFSGLSMSSRQVMAIKIGRNHKGTILRMDTEFQRRPQEGYERIPSLKLT